MSHEGLADQLRPARAAGPRDRGRVLPDARHARHPRTRTAAARTAAGLLSRGGGTHERDNELMAGCAGPRRQPQCRAPGGQRTRVRRSGRHCNPHQGSAPAQRGGDRAPKEKKESRWSQRVRGGLGPRLAFVFIVLDLPGIWYLIALKNISISGWATEQVCVIGFNVVMFTFVELPLVGFLVAETTRVRVNAFQAWLHRNGRRLGASIALGFGPPRRPRCARADVGRHGGATKPECWCRSLVSSNACSASPIAT